MKITQIVKQIKVTVEDDGKMVEVTIPEKLVVMTNSSGVRIEMEMADVRSLYGMNAKREILKRRHDTGAAMNLLKEMRDSAEEAGINWKETQELVAWYYENVYDPQKPWTCPV